MDGISLIQFKIVHMNETSAVEDMITCQILLSNMSFVDEIFIGELAVSAKCAEIQKYCANTGTEQQYTTCEQQTSSLSIFSLS